MEFKDLILEKVKKHSETVLVDVTEFRNDLSLNIKADEVLNICKMLKEDTDLEFVLCKDVTAVDWARRKNRFTVVYHIHSFKNNFTLRLKTDIEGDEPAIDSVTSIWASADWYERETMDMYGINFRNHPDLRRMYMPQDFEYYPLRKEFPVIGIPGSLPLPKKEN